MSVDLYLEQVIAGAKLVVVRLLGGRAYWAYGIDRLAAFCRERGIALGVLPGDAREDPELAERSTLGAEDRARLWGYLVHGGIGNSGQLLRFAATLLGRAEPWEEPRPLPPASLYAPGRPAPTLDEVTAGRRGRPVAAVLFYRALLQSGDLAPIDRLLAALDAEGLDAVALAVTSLKEPAAADVVERVLAETGAGGGAERHRLRGLDAGGGGDPGPLAGCDAVVLQVVLAGSEAALVAGGTRGLSPRDLAMNVALPEVDGRVLARAISFKSASAFDAATESWRVVARAGADDRVGVHGPPRRRLGAAAAHARGGAAHRHDPGQLPDARRPARQRGRARHAGELPSRCCGRSRRQGYRRRRAVRGRRRADRGPSRPDRPTSWQGGRSARSACSLPLERLSRLFATLPEAVRSAVDGALGRPGRRPARRATAPSRLGLLPLGNVVVGIQPARGYHIDPAATYHGPTSSRRTATSPSTSGCGTSFGAHAVVHLGKHGNLEWLPGKALALVGGLLPRGGAGAAAAPLPVHRQRSRRGHAGQAARRRP